jgi:hypothetical protein
MALYLSNWARAGSSGPLSLREESEGVMRVRLYLSDWSATSFSANFAFLVSLREGELKEGEKG